MAGGTWLSTNKVRAGAYINFEAVPKGAMTVGDRGIVAIALSLNWGAEDELIEVLSSDMLDGSSKKLVGFTAFDKESKILASTLSYCYKALVYRINKGGKKATATIGDNLTVTAKYAGTFGNKINITVEALDDGSELSKVITYVDGAVVDTQKVATIENLDANDYVSFAGTGKLTPTAGTPLATGTNGEGKETTVYPEFLNLLKMARWQTLACVSSDSSIHKNVDSFIQQMRNDEGRYVQAVLPNYESADSEGIINSVSSVVIDGDTFTVSEFTGIVAGMTAGANVNESNTAKVIKGATRIVNEMTDAEIKKALEKGQFLISTSSSGKIKVEKDINSLHNFTMEKNYNFSKNRVIRTLDEIGTTTCITWEDTYMGKVDNDDNGRAMFKSDLVSYGKELQRIRAIQNFAGSDDLKIKQGPDLDTVMVDWNVKPVDSMEKLYMTVNVRG